ncbi:hypothetical protein AJ79_10262 [Helicocarpus griseus UAMH5409]|uniref:F-box domain-containing protein n=1 Tax=Helicocarpus griseus UAMH5409 TaxID=1447875 RepID=A0A2B7WEK6_9EURO|nr:hypothetical protein AJ79_10262 [Helicocarpus griseus UAMH5409]
MSTNNATANPVQSSEKPGTKDIIRVAGYYRHEFFRSVIQTDSLQVDRGIKSMFGLFATSPSATLGSLEVFPVEILHEILLSLDMGSLLRFRHVNLRASQIVYTIRGYRTVISRAFQALCAILRTNIASWFTFQDLFNLLCT